MEGKGGFILHTRTEIPDPGNAAPRKLWLCWETFLVVTAVGIQWVEARVKFSCPSVTTKGFLFSKSLVVRPPWQGAGANHESFGCSAIAG